MGRLPETRSVIRQSYAARLRLTGTLVRMQTVVLDASPIRDADSFHDVFTEVLGFPEWYGRNMDAWIDCMTHLDDPEAGMSRVTVSPGEILVLEVEDAAGLKSRCPDLWMSLLECAAVVNWRRTEVGLPEVLAISANV
jgi:hypothetical protein